ncbi:MAG: hypothetical protein IT436_01560 [Phycisphaerales bacterium]|nr:hypothetical protein [Phycisphaerales bacterium]
MKMQLSLALLTATVAASTALAQSPKMGGPMEHIMVSLTGNQLEAMTMPTEPPLLKNYGETYAGPASILTGTFYNAQYGWMVEGFWSPPAGSSIWIECLSATPGLRAYAPTTFTPVFGTAESSMRIRWSGVMLHNWYAADGAGLYNAQYRIYFGDADGNPTPGYRPGEVTLQWETECLVDFNGDAIVDFADYLEFLNLYDAQDLRIDFATDGVIDFADYLEFLNLFDAGC